MLNSSKETQFIVITATTCTSPKYADVVYGITMKPVLPVAQAAHARPVVDGEPG